METSDFAAQRPRLIALAARMLGSSADADDVAQEAWLRLSRAGDVEDLPAWLTTVVTRLCLDQLRRRRTRSTIETQAAEQSSASPDPETDALTADEVGDAMQIVLDALSPSERAAFVLHDVFGYPFDAIAAILGRSDTTVRQLASRARRKVRGSPEPAPAERAARRDVVDAFLTAARGGDLMTLMTLLAPDAVMRADSAGQAMGTDAAYRGAEAVAARFDGAQGAVLVGVDDELGAAWLHRGAVKVVFAFVVDSGLVREIELIADPDVLNTLDITHGDGRPLGAGSTDRPVVAVQPAAEEGQR